MLLANQIAGFLKNMIKKLDFLHVDTNSLKLRVD